MARVSYPSLFDRQTGPGGRVRKVHMELNVPARIQP